MVGNECTAHYFSSADVSYFDCTVGVAIAKKSTIDDSNGEIL